MTKLPIIMDDLSPCPVRVKKDGKYYCNLATVNAKKPCATDAGFCKLCENEGWHHHKNNKAIKVLSMKCKKNASWKKYVQAEKRFGEGPGTELHKMIPAFLERKDCSCKDFAKKMNIWGVEGCEKHIEQIVNKLMSEAKNRPLFSWVPASMTRPVVIKMIRTAIQRAREKEGKAKHNWFVAVTTAPRKSPTLQTCLDSLVINGWRPHIFAEPGNYSFLGQEFHENIHFNEEKRGVWWNWIVSARYALENSDADIIMTVQDDSLFHPDSKEFAEKLLWPSPDVGFVSLYTPKHYSIKNHLRSKPYRPLGLNKIVTKALWGACAMIWPRPVLEQVLEHELIEGWLGAPLKTKSAWAERQKKRREEPWTIQNSDTALGKIMNRMGRSMWFVDPSPVQHIAKYSAINHGGNEGRRNCGRCAKFSESLVDQVPLHINGVEPESLVDTKDLII